jgi:hypothetical protein
MNVNFPVFHNAALDVNEGSEDATLAPPSANNPLKTWQHPGYCEDPVKMVCAMARARGLITRATASSAGGCETGGSMLTHVAQLASKWDLVAYTMGPDQIGEELGRGPVCAVIPVKDSLMGHVSSIMSSSSPSMYMKQEDESNEHGFLGVVILKCTGDGFTVAVPWGKFPKRQDGTSIWDGCVDVHRDVVLNPCAMCKRDRLSPPATHGGVRVKIMSKTWLPATTRPLPSTSSTSVHSGGKVKKLGKKSRHPTSSLKSKFNDENVSVVIKCVVTSTIIILSILCLVVLKSKRH